MTPCDRYEDALWDAAESGVLPDDLQRHCRECPRCQAALSALKTAVGTLAALHDLPHPAPRPVLPAPRPVRLRWALALGLAAVCAAFLLMSLLPPRRPVVRAPRSAPRVPVIVRQPAPHTPVVARQPAPRVPVVVWQPRQPAPVTKRAPVITRGHPTPPQPHRALVITRGHPTPPQPHRAPVQTPAPGLVTIVRTATLPCDTMLLETDRVVLLDDALDIANDVFLALESVGEGDPAHFQNIYENPAFGRAG